jgi:hypothetical protein
MAFMAIRSTASTNGTALRTSQGLPRRQAWSESAPSFAGLGPVDRTDVTKASWLAGGVLLGSVVPLTLLIALPTNDELLDPAAESDLDRVQQLLTRWNGLHAVRSLLSGSAFLLFAAFTQTAQRPKEP